MFSKKEALRFGWSTFKAHWLFLLIVTVFTTFIGQVPNLFLQYISDNFSWLKISIQFVFWVLGFVLGVGQMRILLLLLAGKKPELADLFREWKLTFYYMLGSLLYIVLVFVGYLFFIVPGIIISTRLQFWNFVLVNKQCGLIFAFKESWRITKGSTMNIILLNIVNTGVLLVGVFFLVVGVFAAIPVTLLAGVFVYSKLQLGEPIPKKT